jgi:hypothetical protein
MPSNFNAGPPAFTASTSSPDTGDPLEELLEDVLPEEVELLDELELALEELPPDEAAGPAPPHPVTKIQVASAPPIKLDG